MKKFQVRTLVKETPSTTSHGMKSSWDSFEYTIDLGDGKTFTGFCHRPEWEVYLAKKVILVDKIVTVESVEALEDAVRVAADFDRSLEEE